jgi:hypothetical protein
MSNTLFGGFKPADAIRCRANPYPVNSSNGAALFRGDVVIAINSGVVAAATAGATDILGVCKEVAYYSGGKLIRDTYLPVTTVYSPTTLYPGNTRTASRAWVYDDPNTEYWACVASHADTDTAAEIYAARFANMDITATAGSTVYKQSGHVLDGAVVAAGAAQFRLLEARRIPGNDLTSANWQARVAINEGFHAFLDNVGM